MITSHLYFQDIPHLEQLKDVAQKRKFKIYLVGGYLRDYLLKRERLDFDFAVQKNALHAAKIFSTAIKGVFVLLDKEHGCARVVKKKDSKILTYDFADFRAKTLNGDINLRDFSINTLCVDIADIGKKETLPERMIDQTGAKKDIKAKIIRMVSRRSFKDDPLRLIRAFSLQAELEFTIEAKTLSQMKKDTRLLKGISYERICDELFKILATPNAFLNLKMMDKIGLLEKIMPQITVMDNVKQGGYHHLDVWPHSLQTVCELEKIFTEVFHNEDISKYLHEPLAADRRRFALLKLAALLHDIGKPDTKKVEGKKTSFHGHEHVGKNIVRQIAIYLKLSVKERHVLEDLVLWHLRPGYLSNFKSPSERSVFRYFRDTKGEAVSILLLSLADQRATRGPLTSTYDQKHHEEIVKRLIKIYFDKKKEKPLVRLITGHDLIRKLKLKPSPIFAKILREVEEKQAVGLITTKVEALQLAEKISK